jgi:CTP synthase
MTNVKLLFIEDEPESIQPVIKSLKKRSSNYNCTFESFAGARKAIEVFAPDIVVLDILVEGASPGSSTPGESMYDWLWASRFCPIIVYSAQPEIISETHKGHPFVKFVKKGKKSVAEIMSVLAELQPQVEAVYESEKQIRQAFALALREVAPYAFEIYKKNSESTERNNLIIRAGRRRLAALMDDLSRHGQVLASWEQYICPPVSEDILLGDILLEKDKSPADPFSFCIVLTPSCDLVASGGRSPKVTDVLVARCCPTKNGIELTSLGTIGETKLKGRLPSLLTHGYFEMIIPLPALAGRIPPMTANLKNLRLIPLNHIAGKGSRFVRVASVDSPFRELVAWAYMQVAARPGLPDRDCNSWCNEIIETYKTKK